MIEESDEKRTRAEVLLERERENRNNILNKVK